MDLHVYKLDKIYDDPRFEGFAFNEFRDDPFVEVLRDGSWKAPHLLGNWIPTGVRGRVRPFNDFPCLMGYPAFSERAANALRDILRPNGELIEFQSPEGRNYYAYNVTTVLDALDVEKSAVRFFAGSTNKVLHISRYDFIAQQVAGQAIFRIRQQPREFFVTDIFVDRVGEHNLRGFAFFKVWPLAPGVDWRSISGDEKRRLAREGLPVGQSVKGNSVRIEFNLAQDAGSPEERAKLEKYADEVDRLLIDMLSEAPQVGDLDGINYAHHTCRFLFSCPNADLLVERLIDLLRALNWPAGYRVIKRYGNIDDNSAREKEIAI